MTGGFRWLLLAWLLCLACGAFAETQAPVQVDSTPPKLTEEDKRLLELGQLFMGQNNPAYTLKPEKLTFDVRNKAGDQALRIFRQLTTLQPQYADGWLWLGIALTETLAYTKKHPEEGAPVRTPEENAEGVRAFHSAFELVPDDLIYISYYSEALMVYGEDFTTARTLWEQYLTVAKTDMQRVTAHAQAARALLNQGYYGKTNSKAPISTQAAGALFAAAESHVQEAAKICPHAPDVKAMQELLEKYHDIICGK